MSEVKFAATSIGLLNLEAKKKKKGKDWDPNPWAVCHTTVDKDEEPEKFERCVKHVKEKQSSAAPVKLAGSKAVLGSDGSVRVAWSREDWIRVGLSKGWLTEKEAAAAKKA